MQLTQQNLVANVFQSDPAIDILEDDVMIGVLPFSIPRATFGNPVAPDDIGIAPTVTSPGPNPRDASPDATARTPPASYA